MSARFSLLGASLLAAVALVGCPKDAEPPTPAPRSQPSAPSSTPAPTPTTTTERPVEPAVSDPPASSDRARLLGMTPAEVFAGGLRGRAPDELAPALAGEGALAMSEQLRANAVPIEALDLCLVAFDRARERSRAATVEDPVRTELGGALAVQAGELPTLAAWVGALADRVFVQADLTAAVAFLTKVRTVYALSATLTGPR